MTAAVVVLESVLDEDEFGSEEELEDELVGGGEELEDELEGGGEEPVTGGGVLVDVDGFTVTAKESDVPAA